MGGADQSRGGADGVRRGFHVHVVTPASDVIGGAGVHRTRPRGVPGPVDVVVGCLGPTAQVGVEVALD